MLKIGLGRFTVIFYASWQGFSATLGRTIWGVAFGFCRFWYMSDRRDWYVQRAIAQINAGDFDEVDPSKAD